MKNQYLLRASSILRLVCIPLLLSPPAPGAADISGTVLDADTLAPVAGARVHLQADPASPVAVTGGDGVFALAVSPAGLVEVTASVEYDRAAPVSYNIGGAQAFDGDSGVEIRLPVTPTTDNPFYAPALASNCAACHPGQVDPWSTSNHSLAAIDGWVLDLFSGTGTPGGAAGYVFRDLHDPGDTGFCATCHAPMAEALDPGNVFLDEVTDTAAREGVSCVGCHKIDSVNGNVDALHLLGNATYRFPDKVVAETVQYVWGPLDDASIDVMKASHAPVFAESRFCASCHQYTNPTTGAPGQNTYGEWLASPFATAGPDFRACQDCHMPPADTDGTICAIGNSPVRPAEQNRSHAFVGATGPSLAAAIELVTSAEEAGGRLRVRAEITNHGVGHSFPSGISIRNALLVISASFLGQPLTQVAGPTLPFWADDDLPGRQPGDYAGDPGKGFAKILEGRINGIGPTVRPVLFIDAEGVFSDTLIPSGVVDVTEVEFELPPGILPGDVVDIEARLLYRRAFRALAVTKGWTETPQGGPIETEVAGDNLAVTLGQGSASPWEVPATSPLGLALLGAGLAAFGLKVLRRASKTSSL